jgi:deoxycytidylate deaminase
LITTVGTETDDVIKNIEDRLKLFNYSVEKLSVSELILSQFETNKIKFDSEYDRITHYMDLGNEVRKKSNDGSILMKGICKYIYQKREKDSENRVKPQKRKAYIIKSLKHPDEVGFMRDTYGHGFHLIGVTSSSDRRIDYLVNRKGLSKEKAEKLLKRDEKEELKQGQHTQDAFQLSDYFINITEDGDHTYNSIERLLDLLFGNPFISPSFDEYAMYMAYSSSLRSADLSRQVGAVVCKNNEILSTGANDCPKYGGGLYWPIKKDHGKFIDVENGRDYMLGYDSNKVEQLKMIQNLLVALNIEINEENINIAKNSGIGDLTEYGRVVHAEMESLLSCSRNNISCRNATLYVTTFPCHNCAKHIIAAGIEKVVYIEPYPKSKAFDFYKAEISGDDKDSDKVIFEHFTGVGPRRFNDLFAVSSNRWYAKKRKDKQGNKIEWKREEAELRNPIVPFSYLDSEELALMTFEDVSLSIKKEKNENDKHQGEKDYE